MQVVAPQAGSAFGVPIDWRTQCDVFVEESEDSVFKSVGVLPQRRQLVAALKLSIEKELCTLVSRKAAGNGVSSLRNCGDFF